MPRIYKISRAGIRLIYKMRHHRGHGIHSPFVFDLVNKAIEEKLSYYGYQDIKDYVELKKGRRTKDSKTNRLLFKLVNYFEAKKILEIGSGEGISTLYLTSPLKGSICHCLETNPKKWQKATELYSGGWNRNITLHTETLSLKNLTEKQDCIYINLKNYKNLSNNDLCLFTNFIQPKTVVIVEGIRTNSTNRALWKSIKEQEGRTTILDLFNIGIVFFNPELYPWEYKISF